MQNEIKYHGTKGLTCSVHKSKKKSFTELSFVWNKLNYETKYKNLNCTSQGF